MGDRKRLPFGIIVDPTLPKGTVRFMKDGKETGRIENVDMGDGGPKGLAVFEDMVHKEALRVMGADGGLDIIRMFVAKVESRAEKKMLRTCKLEGAHYAAMKELLAEMEEVAREDAADV